MASTHQTPAKDNPGVIMPPPLIYIGVLALGLLAGWAADAPGLGLPFVPRVSAGAILSGAGLALILIAAQQFNAAGTNIPPWKPATALVTRGIYDYSRNPIYLGMALIYAGLSCFADSIIALALLPVALVVMHYGVIRREERYLEGKFGEDYRKYMRRVRRWV